MTRNEKFQIQRRTVRRDLWRRWGGTSALSPKVFFIPLYLAGAVFVWSRQDAISAQAERTELISPILEAAMTHALAAYLLAGGVALGRPAGLFIRTESSPRPAAEHWPYQSCWDGSHPAPQTAGQG